MTLRTLAASMALAAGSLLFGTLPSLNAQSYGYDRPYGNGGYYDGSQRYEDRDDRFERSRQNRYEKQMRKLEHERDELNRALYRRDYRAARREEREIAQIERQIDREFGRRGYSDQRYQNRDDRYWNR